jgi:hypothetical protein
MTSPTIASVSASITFEENAVNATPAALAPNIVVTDPEGDFDGGALRVSGLLPIVDLAAVSSISFLREVFALYAAPSLRAAPRRLGAARSARIAGDRAH